VRKAGLPKGPAQQLHLIRMILCQQYAMFGYHKDSVMPTQFGLPGYEQQLSNEL